MKSDNGLFAVPPAPVSLEECGFYHVMDIPGHGVTSGPWDLRGNTDKYLGNHTFYQKRVLEIGPASGFLTFEMEKRGADVVVVDVDEADGWNYVPFPSASLDVEIAARRDGLRRMRNGFWLAHRAFSSRAKAWYGDTYKLPDDLGRFDIAVMAAVLLHVHSPLLVMAQCAKLASTLIVTDLCYDDLEGRAVSRLLPTAENKSYDTWWHLSSDLICQFAGVLGFTNITVSKHTQKYSGGELPFFTVVATKP